MKKLRLFTFLVLTSLLTLLILVGCKKDDGIESVSLKDYDPGTAIEIELGDFDYSAYTVVVVYKSGITEEILLTEQMIAETDLFKLYQAGEHDIAVNYGGSRCTFKLSVKRSSFKELAFPENNVFTYNGEAHTVEVDGELPANAVVTYIGGNSFVNAGTYDVTAVVSCEGYVTQRLSTTVKIEKAKYDMSGVKFEGKEVVYNGNSHSIAISGKLPDGVSHPTYTIDGKAGSSAINAGEYKVKAAFVNSNPNYEAIPEMEAVLKITPAEYTVKGVDIIFKSESGSVINGTSKIYDGKSITFDLNDYSKLSKKITVSFAVYDRDGNIISTSNKKTNVLDVGIYTARVEFTMENDNNYKPIPPLERSFEVLKAEYPALNNIQFLASQSQYDGNAHSSVIEGRLPTGVTVSYEYYKDGMLLLDSENKPVQSVVNVGRYTVKAIFKHTDKNLGEIPPLSAILNIVPVNFNVSNLGIELNEDNMYNGSPKALTVIGELPDEISAVVIYYQNGKVLKNADGSYVSSVVEPGEYNAYVQFASTTSNYVISGMLEYAFTIKKCVINPYDIERVGAREITYNGESQSPVIKNGTLPNHVIAAEQLFWIDEDGNRTAVESAVNIGKYVKVITLTVDDQARYELLNSAVIEWPFEIVPQVIDVSVINIGTGKLTYNGTDLTPTLKDVPELVECVSTLYTLEGTEPITEAVNVGKYRLEIAITLDNRNYVLTSNNIKLEFEITPILIDVNAILVQNAEYKYTGSELGLRVFEDLTPEIKKYLNYRLAYSYVLNNEEWVECFNTGYRAEYRVVYDISIKPEYQGNICLLFNGQAVSYVNPYYYFSIV